MPEPPPEPGAQPRSEAGGPFRRFVAASAVSFLGDGFRYAALPLLAIELGAGPSRLGLLLAAAAVPFLVVGLLGGVVVDRVSRRSVLLVADGCRAAIVSGSTGEVLGHGVAAHAMLGTFLRAFTFGHVRQLDQLTEAVLTPAWAAGAGLPSGPRRSAPYPDAERLGELGSGGGAVRQRGRGSGPPRRRDRPARIAGRFSVLVEQGHQGVPPP